MRSTPLFCQSDERDVHKEGGLLKVLQGGGGERQPHEDGLIWTDSMSPCSPSAHHWKGRGTLTANGTPCTRMVVPVRVENLPSDLIGRSPPYFGPAWTECQKLTFDYQFWRQQGQLVDHHYWRRADTESEDRNHCQRASKCRQCWIY